MEGYVWGRDTRTLKFVSGLSCGGGKLQESVSVLVRKGYHRGVNAYLIVTSKRIYFSEVALVLPSGVDLILGRTASSP